MRMTQVIATRFMDTHTNTIILVSLSCRVGGPIVFRDFLQFMSRVGHILCPTLKWFGNILAIKVGTIGGINSSFQSVNSHNPIALE